ncbi:MAG: hypothetical protein EOO29_14175 [Comamonadaceae bacterium]|nr:MAG: hypothetical protein EOO29_14175 [Comamonadaceae bacterium]
MTRVLGLVPAWAWALAVLLLAAYGIGAARTISGLRADALVMATQGGVLTAERDDARDAASLCSDAVDALRTLADQRAAEARRAQGLAQKAARQRQAVAQQILATPPAVPGDDCRSAQVRVDAWLQGRGQ